MRFLVLHGWGYQEMLIVCKYNILTYETCAVYFYSKKLKLKTNIMLDVVLKIYIPSLSEK